jgi:signal peptidase I
LSGFIVAIGVALMAVASLWTVRKMVGRRLVLVTVRGNSMEPTFADGDRVLVRRNRTCREGDVVVFAMPEGEGEPGLHWLVKRVAQVSGERVPGELRSAVTEEIVPAGYLVVRGDAVRSLDSRQLGFIAESSVLGVVAYPVRSAPPKPLPAA